MDNISVIREYRAAIYVGPIVDVLDLALRSPFPDPDARHLMVEYVILQAIFDCGLFYSDQLGLAHYFKPEITQLLQMLSRKVQTDVRKCVVGQLEPNFWYRYEFELESATLEYNMLRLVMIRQGV